MQGVHGGPHGAPIEKHIVDEYDSLAGDIKGDHGGLDIGSHAPVQIVAMHADVEFCGRDRMAPDSCQAAAEALSQGDSSTLNSDQHNLLTDDVSLGDFMGNAYHRPLDARLIEDNGGLSHLGGL